MLSCYLSYSHDSEFFLDDLEMAMEGGRKPEIFYSTKGCQFTYADFVDRLRTEKIKISWSGRRL